jgi:hypothetical protein
MVGLCLLERGTVVERPERSAVCFVGIHD